MGYTRYTRVYPIEDWCYYNLFLETAIFRLNAVQDKLYAEREPNPFGHSDRTPLTYRHRATAGYQFQWPPAKMAWQS